MDRFINIRLTLTFCFFLWIALGFDSAMAGDAVQQAIPVEQTVEQSAVQTSEPEKTNTPNKQETLPTANAPVTTTDTLSSQFPHLQRALIILTVINFVAIIFASLMYLVKRRMQQFSPAPLARLNQEI